jgi:hypothetical protein
MTSVIKVNGLKDRQMDKVNLNKRMDHMKGKFNHSYGMGRVLNILAMEIIMMDNMSMAFQMAMEFIFGTTDAFIKDILVED